MFCVSFTDNARDIASSRTTHVIETILVYCAIGINRACGVVLCSWLFGCFDFHIEKYPACEILSSLSLHPPLDPPNRRVVTKLSNEEFPCARSLLLRP